MTLVIVSIGLEMNQMMGWKQEGMQSVWVQENAVGLGTPISVPQSSETPGLQYPVRQQTQSVLEAIVQASWLWFGLTP